MIGQVIQATKVNWNAKKGPLSHQKMKCLVLDYIQLLMISRVIWVMKFNWNVIKGPLSHHKMKCSFLDYVQQVSTQGQICSAFSSPHGNAAHLWWAMYQWINPTLLQSIAFRLWQIYLPKIVRQCGQLSSSPTGSAAHLWWEMMIGWVIWVMKVNLNVKKAPLSHQKMKNSFLYYVQLLMIGQVIQATKDNWNAKKGPLSHQKTKCSVLDYIQLLMISGVIWVTKFNWNVKKGPLSHHKMKCSFLDYVRLLMIGWATYNFQYVSWLFVSRTSRSIPYSNDY